MRKHERKKCRMYVDLEKTYDRVNREAIWQVLRMYDMSGKLLNGSEYMFVNISKIR